MNISEKIITDSLGFPLTVAISVADIGLRGRHKTFEDIAGVVSADAEHEITINPSLTGSELAEVISHECYHLFFSIRDLILVDEETEVEVFGQLVKRIIEIVGASSGRAQVDEVGVPYSFPPKGHPMQMLGDWLQKRLDEDDYRTVEPMLLNVNAELYRSVSSGDSELLTWLETHRHGLYYKTEQNGCIGWSCGETSYDQATVRGAILAAIELERKALSGEAL